MVEELGCGEVVREYIDVDNAKKVPHTLKLDTDWINEHLGTNIPAEEQIAIFKKLGFGYENGSVIVPNTRVDIVRECDLAEEVARIYGYNEIPTTLPLLSSVGEITPRQHFENKMVDCMLAQGFYETMSFSFISPRSYEKLRFSDEMKKSVVLQYPLGEDTSVMRTSMLPSLMTVANTNIRARNLEARFFELGRIFQPANEKLPIETDVLGMCAYGPDEDFFTIKGALEELLNVLVVDARFVPVKDNKTYHPGRCADIYAGDVKLGTVGELHPAVTEAYDISCRVYCAELNIPKLFEARGEERKYKPLPKYPSTSRDLSLVCDDEVTSDEIIDIIRKNAKHLESVSIFDMYKGEQVPEGKKSLSYKLVLRKDGSMTDEEADAVVAKVLKALAEKNITLRA